MTGVVLLGLKLAYPYKSIPDQNSRAFARSFWTERARDSELVCVKSDLGLGFNRRNWTLFRSALYLCNQKIYSPRHRLGVGVNWDAISADRPLRCVLYNEWPENNPACSAWLQEMTERFAGEKPRKRSSSTNRVIVTTGPTSKTGTRSTNSSPGMTSHPALSRGIRPSRRCVGDLLQCQGGPCFATT